MRWMWIDRIVTHEPGRRLLAVKTVTAAEEHLRDYLVGDDGVPVPTVMPASLMIEGMAQAAGILVGAVNDFREKVILAKIVMARFESEVRLGEVISYDAKIERIDDLGALTSGAVARLMPPETTWDPIGRVDLMFSHVDRNSSGLEFPEENFVFTDTFQVLLDDARLKTAKR